MTEKTYATNRKAYHDYHVLEVLEAGVTLTGTEVKSVRAGRLSLREAYAQVRNGELWLIGAHIARYEPGSRENVEPTRERKLLVHREEIGRLAGKTQEGGVTLVPLRMYDKQGRIKVEVALARGKREYDKRESIARRDAQREADRALREWERGRG